jgi:hypothetical protein
MVHFEDALVAGGAVVAARRFEDFALGAEAHSAAQHRWPSQLRVLHRGLQFCTYQAGQLGKYVLSLSRVCVGIIRPKCAFENDDIV